MSANLLVPAVLGPQVTNFALLLLLLGPATPVQGQPAEAPTPTVPGWVMVSAGVGYPAVVSGGATIVFGREKQSAVPGRSRSIRGFKMSGEVGLGAFAARAGWAALTALDVGYDGWSLDLVYLRPWGVGVGHEGDGNYLGPGVTRHFSWFRVSGALVAELSGSQHRLTPVIEAGVVFSFGESALSKMQRDPSS